MEREASHDDAVLSRTRHHSYQADAIARTAVFQIRSQKPDGIQNSGWGQQLAALHITV